MARLSSNDYWGLVALSLFTAGSIFAFLYLLIHEHIVAIATGLIGLWFLILLCAFMGALRKGG